MRNGVHHDRMNAPETRLVPAAEAAQRLGRHPITLREDLRAGRVPGVRLGGRWFVSSATLDRLTGDSAVGA
jgi:hypothetical protein